MPTCCCGQDPHSALPNRLRLSRQNASRNSSANSAPFAPASSACPRRLARSRPPRAVSTHPASSSSARTSRSSPTCTSPRRFPARRLSSNAHPGQSIVSRSAATFARVRYPRAVSSSPSPFAAARSSTTALRTIADRSSSASVRSPARRSAPFPAQGSRISASHRAGSSTVHAGSTPSSHAWYARSSPDTRALKSATRSRNSRLPPVPGIAPAPAHSASFSGTGADRLMPPTMGLRRTLVHHLSTPPRRSIAPCTVRPPADCAPPPGQPHPVSNAPPMTPAEVASAIPAAGSRSPLKRPREWSPGRASGASGPAGEGRAPAPDPSSMGDPNEPHRILPRTGDPGHPALPARARARERAQDPARRGRSIPAPGVHQAAHGLLKNLVARPDEPDTDGVERFAVVAGGRRLAALQALAENGTLHADHPVPCKIARERQYARALACRERELSPHAPGRSGGRVLRARPLPAPPSPPSPRASGSPSAWSSSGFASATPRPSSSTPTAPRPSTSRR